MGKLLYNLPQGRLPPVFGQFHMAEEVVPEHIWKVGVQGRSGRSPLLKGRQNAWLDTAYAAFLKYPFIRPKPVMLT